MKSPLSLLQGEQTSWPQQPLLSLALKAFHHFGCFPSDILTDLCPPYIKALKTADSTWGVGCSAASQWWRWCTAVLHLVHPKTWLAFFAAKACYWLILNLPSAQPPYISAELLSSPSLGGHPSAFQHLVRIAIMILTSAEKSGSANWFFKPFAVQNHAEWWDTCIEASPTDCTHMHFFTLSTRGVASIHIHAPPISAFSPWVVSHISSLLSV